MRLLVPFFAAVLGLQAQVPGLAEVQERRLSNGARLLLVERRDLAAFHAALVFRGGRAEESTATAGATDLLARALFGATWPEDLAPPDEAEGLDALLKQEEGFLESIRLERLRLRRAAGDGSQLASLEAGLAQIQSRLKARQTAPPLADLYTARGGRQSARATADALVAETQLPQEAFEFWCRTEAQRLRALQLSRFSEARSALVSELKRPEDPGMALLKGAALPGHPYGRNLLDHLPALEALRWSDLRAFARHALSPDRLLIILAGGFGMDTALPLVERHFGALSLHPGQEEAVLPEIPAALGDRRVQAALGSAPRLLVGWRIPPRPHPDHLALRMAALLLGEGRAGRLQDRLVGQKALAQRVEVQLDVPGGRFPGLLVVELEPADGHSLAELEHALQGEILRLQQDPIPQDAWQRALAQAESGQAREQDEPASLARALGQGWVEGGNWRLGDLELQRLRNLGQETVQAAARAWLNPDHRTAVLLEPAPRESLDPLEAEMARVLKALAALRIEDPAKREHLVAEGIRQLRMLSAEERARTLKLLEAQLAPEKR